MSRRAVAWASSVLAMLVSLAATPEYAGDARALSSSPPLLAERFFRTFDGKDVPLRPRGEINREEADRLRAYVLARYDASGNVRVLVKYLDGEAMFSHSYEYYDNGRIKLAYVKNDQGELHVMTFDRRGRLLTHERKVAVPRD